MFLSPRAGIGTTTVGQYFVNALTGARETSLYIEISKNTGYTSFINGNTLERNKCLSNIVINTHLLRENTCKSKYNPNVFYICQNIANLRSDMDKYPINFLKAILDEATENFPVDYIVIDLPSNLDEHSRLFALSTKLGYRVSNWFICLDENALTFNMLQDMSELSNSLGEPEKPCTIIVNKTTENYTSYIEKYNPFRFPPLNLVKVPYIKDMVDLANRGKIYAFSNKREMAELTTSMQTLVSIVKNHESGYGLELSKESIEIAVQQGRRILDPYSTPTDKKDYMNKEIRNELKKQKANKQVATDNQKADTSTKQKKGLFNFSSKPKQSLKKDTEQDTIQETKKSTKQSKIPKSSFANKNAKQKVLMKKGSE